MTLQKKGESDRIMYVDWKNINVFVTHTPITETHSAGFSFAEEKETAIALHKGRTFTIFSPAANFAGVLSLWKQENQNVVTHQLVSWNSD